MLKEFTFRQVADKAAVGGEKVIARQVFEGDPADIVEYVMDQLAVEGADREELEVDGASIAVRVVDAGDERADFGTDAELFV